MAITTIAAVAAALAMAPPAGAWDDYVSQFGKLGSANGLFHNPTFSAIDPKTGDVYVVDSGNNRVEKFSSAGNYLAQFGSNGTFGGEFSDPYGIAIDPSNGDTYVADLGNNRVAKFGNR